MSTKIGTIINFTGSWASGIATLVIKNKDGEITPIYCENANTVRALDSAFGGVINPNHTVNVSAIVGKTIEYQVESGLLAAFSPVEVDVE